MEAQQVVGKILADAKAEAEKIKKQADETQAAEQAKLDEQLSGYKKQTGVLAKNAGEDEKAHILAAARMDIAKQLLVEKRKILDEIFEQARQQLEKLSDESYLKLTTKLMLNAVETGDEEVVIDSDEKRIDQSFIDSVNQQLDGKGELKLSADRANLGKGFILKRGRIKNNVSIEVLLAQVREELEIELAKDLFGK